MMPVGIEPSEYPLPKIRDEGRELGDDARHDDQRHAVADAATGYLLAQPQQEHGPAHEADNRADAEHDARVDDRLQPALRTIAFEPGGEEVTLDDTQEHRAVAGVLVELLPPDRAFLLERGEAGMQRGCQLHDDRGGDVGHDAERDEAHPLKAAARKGVEQVEDPAARLIVEIAQDQRVHARQRNEAEEAEDDQGPDGEPDTVLQLGGLGEVCEAHVARDIVGA